MRNWPSGANGLFGRRPKGPTRRLCFACSRRDAVRTARQPLIPRSIMHVVPTPDAEPPTEGRIVVEWKRIPKQLGLGGFDWQIRMEQAGLPDDDVERLLREIADRL